MAVISETPFGLDQTPNVPLLVAAKVINHPTGFSGTLVLQEEHLMVAALN